jgi:hypothetical protein
VRRGDDGITEEMVSGEGMARLGKWLTAGWWGKVVSTVAVRVGGGGLEMEAQCMEVGQSWELSAVKEPGMDAGSQGEGSSWLAVGMTSGKSAKELKVGVWWGKGG